MIKATKKPIELTLISEKGGVGKSFTTVNLASCLANRGYKVLIVDTDSNGSASWWTNGDVEPHKNIGSLLLDPQQDASEFLISLSDNDKLFDKANGGSLFLLSSGPDLGEVNKKLLTANNPDRRLLRVLRPIKKDFDFILVDCKSDMENKLTQNAVVASDYCLVVVLPEWLSFVASVETTQHIDRIRSDNELESNLLGVIFNLFEDSQEQRKTLLDANEEFGDKIFKTIVPHYKSFSSRPRAQASYLSLGVRYHTVFEDLTNEIMERLGV